MNITENRHRLKPFPYYLTVPAVVAAVFFVMLAVRRVYPFGNESIFTCDLGVAEIPAIERFCSLFSGGSFFYNWKCAFGFPGDCLPLVLDPFNYLCLLFPAARFRDFTTYYILLKFLFVAFSSSLFFRKVFPRLPTPWAVYFSVLYTFSGYTLQYYSNTTWLNVAGLVPFLCLLGFSALRGNKKALAAFAALLFYQMLQSSYMSFFVVVFLLLESGLWIFFMLPHGERGKAAFRLGTAVGFPLAAASGFLYTAFFGISSSVRFEEGTASGGITAVLFSDNDALFGKLLLFCGLEFAVLCFILLLKKYREAKNAVLFFTVSAALFVIPVFVVGSDLLWHLGSYRSYPMRFGFALPLVFLSAAAWYLERYWQGDGTERHRALVFIKPAVAAVLGIVSFSYLYAVAYNCSLSSVVQFATKESSVNFSGVFTAAFLSTLACFFVISLIKNKKMRLLMNGALLLMTFCLSVGGLLGMSGRVTIDRSILYIEEAKELSSSLSPGGVFDRISNPDLSLAENYAYFTDRTSVSAWAHSVSGVMNGAVRDMGFTTDNTRIRDTGATAFTQALAGISEAVSRTALDENLYTLKSTAENGYSVYACNYTLPFGQVFDSSLTGIKNTGNVFEYQNNIYTALTGDTNLMKETKSASQSYTIAEEDKNGTATPVYKLIMEMTADKNGILYFTLSDGNNDYYAERYNISDLTVTVTDKSGAVVGGVGQFRSTELNNVAELGAVKAGGRYTITATSAKDFKDYFVLYTLDTGKLRKLCESNRGAAYTVDGDTVTTDVSAKEGQILFVPTTNDTGWRCTINGKDAQTVTVLGAFIGVRLNAGENHVVLRYVPEKFWVGAATAAAFAAAFVLYLLLCRRRDFADSKILTRLSAAALAALWGMGILILYVVPVAFLAVKLIKALPFL